MRADLACLRAAAHMVRRTLAEAPGLRGLYADLCAATLSLRQAPHLPEAEATVEAVIRHLLGGAAPLGAKACRMVQAIGSGDLAAYRAPRRYRPFRPVALWPDLRAPGSSQTTGVESRATDGPPEEGTGNRSHHARRRAADQAERSDSFILHKFEAILSWAEFINLNRRVEDDDTDDAKKAADDVKEISLGQISKAPATRLKLHLDLAPEDVDREALSGIATYPEWDVRSGAYLPAHVRVLTSDISPALTTPRFATIHAPPPASAPSSVSSRLCVPAGFRPLVTLTAMSLIPTGRCARGSIFRPPVRAMTGSGAKPGRSNVIWRCRSCSMCHARPNPRCPAMAMAAGR